MRGLAGSWLLHGDPAVAPIAGGAVVLDAGERVVAVGELGALQREHAGVHFERVPAVLTPGLVNAHTHLELSALRGSVPGGRGFAPWAEVLIKRRSERPPELDSEAIDRAISELLGFGVVAIGEVCNHLETVSALGSLPIAGRVFHEVFGMRKDTAEVTLGLAERERAERTSWPAQFGYALAPHTPFTLHPDVLRAILGRFRARGGRTSMHLAEHAAERAYLATGQGAFAEWLKTRGASPVDWDPPGCDSITYARRLGAVAPDVIAVHITDARPEEIAQLAAAKTPVVLCPRSNLHIELKLPPLHDILRAGIRPGLGTDSLASNSSLDPLAEARALQKRFPTVSPLELLAMTCAWGADALGLERVLGRIEPGSHPGVLGFVHAAVPSDPARFVLGEERAERRVLSRPPYQRLPAVFEEAFA